MPKNKSRRARRSDDWAKQTPQGVSWKVIGGILVSIGTLVSLLVGGMDFINYLREGYQLFLWLGIALLGMIWLIILWLLIKQRNIYWILYLMVTILAVAPIWNSRHSYIQAREEKLVVLIAKFEGPEEVFGLRNEIQERLSIDFPEGNNDGVIIETINEIITPDSGSGNSRAVQLGKSFQADIVIWGWYRPIENPNVTFHIENLSPEKHLPLRESTTLHPLTTLEELKTSTFQQETGQSISALISYLVGFIKYLNGNYEVAITHFDKALENLQGTTQSIQDESSILYYRASANHLINKNELAIQDLDKAIAINPRLEAAYISRGSAYFELNQMDKAIQDYDKALEINPQSAIAYNNRGIVYKKFGNAGAALQDFEEAIRLKPDYDSAYYHRGNVYTILGVYQLAIDDYTKVILLEPNSFDAYGNRGIAYANLGDYNEAISDFDQVIRLDPQSSLAYYNRGRTYQEMGKLAEAEADFKKFEEITGQKPPVIPLLIIP
jgi:tetratricopeptide (TPR) repeat protein